MKEDIVVALGLSRSLVTGDGPNFATASLSLQKMLMMIREIKQAARIILNWIFNDWLELKGWEDKTLKFLFNDLDPSDAVDFKRLLIELYDRKLISRSSLQIKMDLDPDIESANRETEKRSVDLLDELEPGVDHKTLQGATLIDDKKKYHIGPLKNKQQLVKALEKAAGEELAEKAKKERPNISEA